MPKSKEYKAAASREWAKNNPEKSAAKAKRWREANKEKAAAYKKKYLAENPERRAQIDRDYDSANPEKMLEKSQRRRTKKEGNGIFIVSKKFLSSLYNSPCRFCGAEENIQADHIIPIHKGGRHSEGNLQPLCKPCNNKKATKLWIEFRSSVV